MTSFSHHMAPRTGRYTNHPTIIPIPYNPFILMKKGQKKKPPKAKIDWYGKAVEYQKMLSMGVAKNKAEIARIEGVSRARVTQILNLINLAPEIRNYLNQIADQNDLKILTERRLRKIAKINNHKLQIEKFQELLQKKIIHACLIFCWICQIAPLPQ